MQKLEKSHTAMDRERENKTHHTTTKQTYRDGDMAQ